MALYLKRRKRLLKKSLVGLCLLSLGVICFFILEKISLRYASLDWLHHPLTSASLMCVIAAALYKPLDRAVTKFFRRFLFQKKHGVHAALGSLGVDVETILDLQELGNTVVNTWGEVLQLKTVALLIRYPDRSDYEILSSYGWSVSDSRKVRLPENSALADLIRGGEAGHIYVRNRVLRALPWQDANKLAHDFILIRSNWVIPLFFKGELLGLLGFAALSPEAQFDEADFQAFRAFAAPFARSIHNAKKYHALENAMARLEDTQSEMLQATKLAAIEQLATGIAHEIHNPLTIISGKAQVLLLKKDKMGLPEPAEEVLKIIVQQTKRAADITRKLLMFSQGSGGVREPLNLVQVLKDTVALVSYQMSLDGIKISTMARGEVPFFSANVHEMREVFLNLIMNAVQSIGSAGGKIHCEVSYLGQEEVLEIVLLDTGPGIPKENLHKLFNPFFTTRSEGVGLGLFVTKQIIHRYGGSIRVESRVGDGTLMMIQLPCPKTSAEVKEQELSVNPK